MAHEPPSTGPAGLMGNKGIRGVQGLGSRATCNPTYPQLSRRTPPYLVGVTYEAVSI